MEHNISLNTLTQDTVTLMSEEEASVVLTKLVYELPREERTKYVNLVSTAFEFRSISAKNRSLRGDLSLFGFKFFPAQNDQNMLIGIKRK